MDTKEFVDLGQRMVVEYYNRYVNKRKKINKENVEIRNLYIDSDDKMEVSFMTNTEYDKNIYNVVYEPFLKEIHSYLTELN